MRRKHVALHKKTVRQARPGAGFFNGIGNFLKGIKKEYWRFRPDFFRSKAVIGLIVAVVVISNLVYLLNPKAVLGQTYSLIQSDWSGGSSAETVTAPSNLTGWNKYSSSSGVTAAAGSVSLTPGQGNFTETFAATDYRDTENTIAAWSTSGQLSRPTVDNTNLSAALSTALGGSYIIYASATDTVNDVIYFGGASGRVGKYTVGTNTFTDLTASVAAVVTIGTGTVFGMIYDSVNRAIYFGSDNNKFVRIDTTSGAIADMSAAMGPATANTGCYRMAYDPDRQTIYYGGSSPGKFGKYAIGGSATDLTSAISFDWGGVYVNAEAYSPSDGMVYIVGGSGKFGKINAATGAWTNLSSVITASLGWAASTNLNTITVDTDNNVIYLAGTPATHLMATYTPAGVATDISSYAYSLSGNYQKLEWVSGGRIFYAAGTASGYFRTSDLSLFTRYSAASANQYSISLQRNLTAAYSFGSASTSYKNTAPCDICYGVSLTLDSTSQNIKSATLTKNDTIGTGTLEYALSNDGGATYATVTPGSLYTFPTLGSDLRFKVTLTGNATVQDISIAYDYNPSSGSLTSSKFDSADNSTVVNRLVWDEDATLPVGTTVTVSLRTADSSANLTSAWTDLTNASPDCAKAGTTVTCGAAALPAGMQDGTGDRWFQYKISMSSTGVNTALVSSVSVQFVINASPEVRNVTAVQNANGTVTINYEVRDIDTQYGTPVNQDHIHPMFEYWDGAAYQTITTLTAGDTDPKAVAHDGSWNNITYSATWTPATDYPGHYQDNTAKVRVTANDGEGANPTGSAESATYSLDTSAPSPNSVTVDASTAVQATVHLSSTDPNPGTMKVSSTDATLTNTTPEAYSATKLMTLSEGATVYARFIDAYSNISNIVSATVPSTPTAVMIQDTSNIISDPHVFRLFVAWKAVSGSFASYRVHRSTALASPDSWPEVAQVNQQDTNYYIDNDVVEGGTYYYYVETVDTVGSVSFKSLIVSGIADGAVSGGEGGGGISPAPIISAVSSGTPKSTEATITWNTDTLSNSVVGYSTSPSTFTSSVTIGSLVNNASGVGAHSVILTGLLPETTYYFRVQSTDVNDQSTTDDNGGAGYSFTTPAGPIISNTSVEQTANTTARVSWVTDISATTQLVHSLRADMTEPTVTTGTSDPTPTHIVNLTNLTPGTIYFFYVKSVDASLNETVDKHVVNGVPAFYTFTTTNDSTPPVISAVSVRTQPTSADIIWTTNEAADSQVEYGLTNAYGTTTTLDSTTTTRHVVTINGLSAETAYHYRIRSRDANSVLATSSDYTFTTSAAGDATPPTITGIAVTSLSLNSASINWATDEPGTSYIDYGTTLGLGSSFGTATFTAAHSVTLDALTGDTQYYFRVRSADAAGNETIDTNGGAAYTFTTAADSTAPAVSGVDDIIQMNSVRVVWTTNELADSQVEYGLTDAYGSSTPLDDGIVLEHAVTISSLSAATAYHYRIKTRDSSGNLTTGPDRVVTTAAQADNAPPIISAVSSSGIARTSATITWTTDEKACSEVQYGPNLTYGYSETNINDNTLTHSVILTGLTPGQAYYYKVISVDGSGNTATGDNSGNGYTFTAIVDSDPPVISAVGTSLVSDTSAVVTWVTDEPANSLVAYGASTAYGSQTAVNATLSTVHSVTITGLSAKTVYYYKVVSADAYSNSATDDNASAGYTLTTTDEPGKIVRARTPESDKTPPMIMNVRIGSITQHAAIIEWNTDEAADTILKYGISIAYGTLAGSVDEKIMAHQVNLAGLEPGTIYHFIAVSSDAYGNQATTTDRQFATLNEDGSVVPLPPQPGDDLQTAPPPADPSTPAEEPPAAKPPENPIMITMNALSEIVKKLISNPSEPTSSEAFSQTLTELAEKIVNPPSIVGIAPRVDVVGIKARISWTTDKKATSTIAYVSEAEYAPLQGEPYKAVVSNPDEFSTIHEVTIENLLPATKYHFQVRSKGLVGGEAKSLDATFQTTSDLPVISGLAVAEMKNAAATLTWTTNVPTNTEIRFKDTATGVELTQGDTAYLRDHKFTLENLKAGAAYSVVVNAQDEFENQVTSRPLVVTTSKDDAPPTISKVSSESTLYPGKESRVQTIISWTTDEPSTSRIYYQEGIAKDAQLIEMPIDSALVVSHTVVITKFRPMTVYKFHVESADASGNASKSNDFLILTPQQKASVLDIIIGNFEQVFGWTKKL